MGVIVTLFCDTCHSLLVFHTVFLSKCFDRTRQLKAPRLQTLWQDLETRRAGGSWERWSCSAPCVWSGSLRTRLPLTLRMYCCVLDKNAASEVDMNNVLIGLITMQPSPPPFSFPTGPVFPLWRTMCSTAMCAITAATRTFSENKQVGVLMCHKPHSIHSK